MPINVIVEFLKSRNTEELENPKLVTEIARLARFGKKEEYEISKTFVNEKILNEKIQIEYLECFTKSRKKPLENLIVITKICPDLDIFTSELTQEIFDLLYPIAINNNMTQLRDYLVYTALEYPTIIQIPAQLDISFMKDRNDVKNTIEMAFQQEQVDWMKIRIRVHGNLGNKDIAELTKKLPHEKVLRMFAKIYE